MGNRILVIGLALGIAATAGGCATSRVVSHASGSASDRFDDRPSAAYALAAMPAAIPVAFAYTTPCAPPPCAPPPCAPPPCAAPCPPEPCGLPCERCESDWHVRALGGFSFWLGTDAGDNCGYVGADVGRNLCGSCWSIDGFWRGHSAQFDRDPSGHDGGTWNHVGVKASYERSLGGGRWFAYGGAGPEYFWTNDYLHDDSGFGVFGEAGIGYVVSRHFRVRAGLDVHGMYTDAGRQSPADDGNSRWLWVVAPVVGLEFDF